MEDGAPFVAIPDNPPPEGISAAWLETADGVRLRAAHWPVPEAARGTALILPGRTEAIEKYFETCGELLARGFAVAALDWRGQGMSARALPDSHKGHVRDFAEYRRDLDCFIAHVEAANLPPPYLILGHSMGAHVALRYLHDCPDRISRAILCGPMAHIRTPLLVHAVARAIAFAGTALAQSESYVPGGRVYDPDHDRFEGNLLTGDPKRFARTAHLVRADERLALGSPTFGWLEAAYRSMALVRRPEYCAAIRTPVLLVYGSDERISDPRYQALIGTHLANCEVHCLRGARHEILQETDAIRMQFWALFDGFAGGEEALSPAHR